MAGTVSCVSPSERYAVVTGANKGIGFEVCRQLASNGIEVVLTARDEKKGQQAVQKLSQTGIGDRLVFHKLNVTDPVSVASLVDFVKRRFGRLDILVNNAAISSAIIDPAAFIRETELAGGFPFNANWKEISTQTYELAEQCIETNYYGAKRMVEAFVPLLQLSHSPRIVNVSSYAGHLQYMGNEWAKGVLSGHESLTEDKVDKVLGEFLQDFKDDRLESKGWPTFLSAYFVSKAAMNAYTRVMANRYPTFRINCVCPGFVKTDIVFNVGDLTATEGAENVVRLALLADDAPSGCFYRCKQPSSF